MGGGVQPLQGVSQQQLTATPYAGATFTTRRQFFGTDGPHAVTASSFLQFVPVANLTDSLDSQQDALDFDYLFLTLTPSDNAGALELVSLAVWLGNAGGFVLAYLSGAYPTLLKPNAATVIGFQPPPLITGADVNFFAKALSGGSGGQLPFPTLRVFADVGILNTDAANPHSLLVGVGGFYRKATGVTA